MKIYTKTGDKGETGLVGGKRIGKDSLRIAAYGEVDELNAVLGLIRQLIKIDPALQRNKETLVYLGKIENILYKLQKELFVLGADLSTPLDTKYSAPRITRSQTKQLEQWIDYIDAKLEPLKNFILPGGSVVATHLHLTRTVCRRAERAIVALGKKEAISKQIGPYINRLSDLFFVLARFANKLNGYQDEKWSQE